MSKFRKIYSSLNSHQKQAVDAIEGPVMIMAGPGTGKTQVLSARIANILHQTDTNPSSVLALTFTQSATKNMRQRLVEMIGQTGYYVQINTFHAFCQEVINSHPEFFTIDQESQPLGELDRYQLLEEIILESDLEILKPLNRPLFYIKEVIKKISDLKKEAVDLEIYQQLITSWQNDFLKNQDKLSKYQQNRQARQLQKNQELAQIYERYCQQLRERSWFDFDDMIALVVEAFTDNELLLREYQENLLYFLVDEFQDTNSAQNRVVDLLASYWGEKANVFVVGDPNQSIFRFQGASLENTLSFKDRYHQAQIIQLNEGYRCPQTIQDVATHLIGQGEVPKLLSRMTLESHNRHLGKISLYPAANQVLESIFIARQIQTLIKSGVEPQQIAVLYRYNSDSLQLQETLTKWGIDYAIDGGTDVLTDEYLGQLLNLLRLIESTKSTDDDLVFVVLNYKWLGFSPLLVMRITRAASRAKVSIINLIEQGFANYQKYAFDQEVTALEFSQLEKFVAQLATWASLDAQLVFPEWFEKIITDSNFLEFVRSLPNGVQNITYLSTLFAEIKAQADKNHRLRLKDFLNSIQTMIDHNLKLVSQDFSDQRQMIRLSTVHKAKGQEWEFVFLSGVVDGKWGNSRQRELISLPPNLLKFTDLSKQEKNDDERRLFYVALTRAKREVILTYPQTVLSESYSREVMPSMFVEELKSYQTDKKQQIIGMVEDTKLQAKPDQFLAKLLTPAPVKTNLDEEKKFFQQLVDKFKLSVTALNSYLRDPQEFVENFLLRVPRAKPEPMAFGSAIHAALEDWNNYLQKEQQHPPLKRIQERFSQSLEKELVTTHDFERRLKYGQQILAQYYQQHNRQVTIPLFVERFFGFGWSKTVLGDIPLTGRIDRVEWIDEEARTVRLIDYKTGKAKSINQIEGKTASQNLSAREKSLPPGIQGPYKRQLLFYRLLTELDRSFIPQAIEGTFTFVEPNASGKFVSRNFSLADNDLEDLKTLIQEVVAEIRSLDFLTSLP